MLEERISVGFSLSLNDFSLALEATAGVVVVDDGVVAAADGDVRLWMTLSPLDWVEVNHP